MTAREPRRLGARIAPLSFAQERLWLIDAAAPGSPTYNVPLLIPWSAAIDVAALRSALTAVVMRHEVLRTTYELRDGRPVQIVHDPHDVDVEVLVASSWEEAKKQARPRAVEPFDLAAAPPLRGTVWQGISGGDALLLTIHHIAVDGWSLAPLFDDLARAYEAALAGGKPNLPELTVQYADFAEWERRVFDDDPALRQRMAGRADELLSAPSPLRLGGAGTVPAAPEGARTGTQHVFDIPEPVFSGVRQVARRTRATPFVVLFAAYTEVLRRWSGRSEFLVGTVTMNRAHPALEDLVGFFVNIVPLRCIANAGWTFAELCSRTRTEAFNSLTYQRMPFDRLTATAAARSTRGHRALVEVGFALQNMPRPKWTPTLLPTGTAKFDVLLIVDESPDGAVGTLEFDAALYPAEFGERFSRDYLALLTEAVAHPDRPLAEAILPHGPLATPQPAADAKIPYRPATSAEYERRAASLFRSALSEVDRTPRQRLGREANFFALGGHSLLAVTMAAEAQRRHGAAIRPGDFLADPTISGLARLLAAESSEPAATTHEAPIADEHPATSVQRRLWFLDRIPDLRAAYLVPVVVELTDVDSTKLRRAVDEVLAHHPALRSRFRLDRRTREVVYRTDGPAASAVVTDARSWSEARVSDHVAEMCWTPFHLAADAPARAEIVVLHERCLLVLCAHHIVVDGRSQQILLDHVARSYRGERLPEPVHPARFPTPVGDGLAELVAALDGAPTDVRLPHDRPRGATQTIEGATVSAPLGAALAARVRAVAAEAGCTTFMTTAALVAVTLARRSGQRDFVFVFPWAGRDDPASTDAVGMFVNTVPVRVDLRGEPTWRELLDRVRAACTISYRNADLPFDAVAAAVHPDRDLSRPPVTPVYVAASDRPTTPLDLGCDARYLPLDPLAVKYELEFTATEFGGELEITLSYLVDLFDGATATGLLASLVSVAAQLAANPQATVSDGKAL